MRRGGEEQEPSARKWSPCDKGVDHVTFAHQKDSAMTIDMRVLARPSKTMLLGAGPSPQIFPRRTHGRSRSGVRSDVRFLAVWYRRLL